MEKLDYKKEYKDLYMPGTEPMLIEVPSMNFIMVQGKGNPNTEGGEYQAAVQLLYSLSYTIKMSKLGKHPIKGYVEYVVPPLEGLWWMQGIKGVDYSRKEDFEWFSMIRQPEFVTKDVFEWACQEVKAKKGIDPSKAQWVKFEEGLCVQCMHKGSYDTEPETLSKMEEFIKQQKREVDIGTLLQNGMVRHHHEIYLSDPRKTKAENIRTVLRIPVK